MEKDDAATALIATGCTRFKGCTLHTFKGKRMHAHVCEAINIIPEQTGAARTREKFIMTFNLYIHLPLEAFGMARVPPRP